MRQQLSKPLDKLAFRREIVYVFMGKGVFLTDISLEAVTGKLNRTGYDAFIKALRHAQSAGNRNVELAHWLFHILQQDNNDLSLSTDHYKVDRARRDECDLSRHAHGARADARAEDHVKRLV